LWAARIELALAWDDVVSMVKGEVDHALSVTERYMKKVFDRGERK
jgi:hypothetical protein